MECSRTITKEGIAVANIKGQQVKLEPLDPSRPTIETLPLCRNIASENRVALETPNKLYGREAESEALRQAFSRVKNPDAGGRPEMVLISGMSGTGKTYLVEQVREAIGKDTYFASGKCENHQVRQIDARKRGYFVSGKFDQLRGRQPYSALVPAFTDLCDQILDLEAESLAIIRSRMRDAVGSHGRVLTDFLPNLAQVVDNRQDVPSLTGTEARNRFNYVFRQFLQAISSPDNPLILFLDDLQFADEASLDLVTTIVSDSANPSLLFLGAYRENEVSPGHPLAVQLREIERRNVPVTRIEIKNLSQHVVNLFMADTLHLSCQETLSITDVVFQRTEGNPFFVIQFVSYLCDENLLVYSSESMSWQWDEARIRSRNIAGSVVELMASKIGKLPKETQDILRMAAAIGSYFDNLTLKLVFRSITEGENVLQRSNVSGLSAILKVASNEGMIARKGKLGYRFTHDKIQQASYSLIPEEERSSLHLKIGHILTRNTNMTGASDGRTRSPSKRWKVIASEDMSAYLDRVLFVAVDQLNRGSSCIESVNERVELARLNLRAAERATDSAAFVQAEQYLTAGLSVLSSMPWEDNYDLSLQLYSSLAEMKYCNSSFDEASEVVDKVLVHAEHVLDKLRVFSVSIKSLGAQSKIQEAIEVGFDVLAQLGEPFPKTVGNVIIAKDLLKTKMMLIGKSDKALSELPRMENKLKIAAMQILCSMLSFTYMCRPQYVPLVAFRMMHLTLRYGCCNESTFGLSTYALILSGILGDSKGGYRFAQLSRNLIERLNAKEWLAHVYGVVYSCCMHWREHIHLSIEPLLLGYHQGMSAGDIEYAMWCCYFACKQSFFAGRPLTALEENMRGYHKLMTDHGQETPLASLSVFWQAVLNLRGRADSATILVGEAMNQEKVLEEAAEMKNNFLISIINLNRLWLAYLLGDYELAAEMAESSRNIQDVAPGVFEVIDQAFYDGLTSCAIAHSSLGRGKWKANARKNVAKLRKWARSAPDNCLHKYLLLQAEYFAAKGKKSKAVETYQKAIDASSQSGFIQDEAIASERLGRFAHGQGDHDSSSRYLARAHRLYLTWGATVKVDLLESEFSSILEQGRGRESFHGFVDGLKGRTCRVPLLHKATGRSTGRSTLFNSCSGEFSCELSVGSSSRSSSFRWSAIQLPGQRRRSRLCKTASQDSPIFE